MSTAPGQQMAVAVVGAGVVGCAVALTLSRRGVDVALLEAEPEPGLGASGTNSGILHTGFDSTPGELETELILAAAAVRDRVLTGLRIPVRRCGALMRPRDDSKPHAVAAIAANARCNGVTVNERDDGGLEIPGEAITDPVFYTLALAGEAQRQGAELLTRFRAVAIEQGSAHLTVWAEDGASVCCRMVVNCAGLEADTVARLAGDDSFSIYPRKGEFLVFDPPAGEPLERILLPVPTKGTKGVLVFPTVDGKLIAGPTAVDFEDKHDWSVRPQARDEILSQAIPIYPPLERAAPIGTYAGLRPAGRGVKYVIGPSRMCPRLVNVAAIRSTGLSASLGIARHVAEIVSALGIRLGPESELRGGDRPPALPGPWWRRAAEFRAAT